MITDQVKLQELQKTSEQENAAWQKAGRPLTAYFCPRCDRRIVVPEPEQAEPVAALVPCIYCGSHAFVWVFPGGRVRVNEHEGRNRYAKNVRRNA